MDPAKFFEAVMLLCFGAAWPFSIYRLVKSKWAEGKSVAFLIIVLVGYLSGILFKITGRMDNVIWLYLLNMIMVSIDLGLCIHYKRARAAEA